MRYFRFRVSNCLEIGFLWMNHYKLYVVTIQLQQFDYQSGWCEFKLMLLWFAFFFFCFLFHCVVFGQTLILPSPTFWSTHPVSFFSLPFLLSHAWCVNMSGLKIFSKVLSFTKMVQDIGHNRNAVNTHEGHILCSGSSENQLFVTLDQLQYILRILLSLLWTCIQLMLRCWMPHHQNIIILLVQIEKRLS